MHSEGVLDISAASGWKGGKGPEPRCVLPESVRHADGIGPRVELGPERGRLLVVTLEINDVLPREALTLSMWGSSGGTDPGMIQLVSFRPKQYCGIYSMLLNLVNHPEVRFLRAQWAMTCWGKGDRTPLFGFQVFLEKSGTRLRS